MKYQIQPVAKNAFSLRISFFTNRVLISRECARVLITVLQRAITALERFLKIISLPRIHHYAPPYLFTRVRVIHA